MPSTEMSEIINSSNGRDALETLKYRTVKKILSGVKKNLLTESKPTGCKIKIRTEKAKSRTKSSNSK
jgi:hypothetical protein